MAANVMMTNANMPATARSENRSQRFIAGMILDSADHGY